MWDDSSKFPFIKVNMNVELIWILSNKDWQPSYTYVTVVIYNFYDIGYLNYAWSFSDLQDPTVQEPINQMVMTPQRLPANFDNVPNLPVDPSSVSSSSITDDGSHVSSGKELEK